MYCMVCVVLVGSTMATPHDRIAYVSLALACTHTKEANERDGEDKKNNRPTAAAIAVSIHDAHTRHTHTNTETKEAFNIYL